MIMIAEYSNLFNFFTLRLVVFIKAKVSVLVKKYGVVLFMADNLLLFACFLNYLFHKSCGTNKELAAK